MYIYVCLVRHEDFEGGVHLYDCTDVQGGVNLACGDEVVCTTFDGIRRGKVVTYPVKIECDYIEPIEAIVAEMGINWPLKKVLRLHGDLSSLLEDEKRMVAEEYYCSMATKENKG